MIDLVRTCEPATFGLGGIDVLDETYRKATKLDPSEFCTNFCSYELGVIDIISQLLMPSVKRKPVQPTEKPTPFQHPADLPPQVDSDVRRLFVAAHGSMGVDSVTLTEIITSRSNDMLTSIIHEYARRYKHELDQALQKRLKGPYQEVLLDVLAEAIKEDRAKRTTKERQVKAKQAGMGIRAELYKLNVSADPLANSKHMLTRLETIVRSAALLCAYLVASKAVNCQFATKSTPSILTGPPLQPVRIQQSIGQPSILIASTRFARSSPAIASL